MQDELRMIAQMNITFELIDVGISRMDARAFAKRLMDEVCKEHVLCRTKVPRAEGPKKRFFASRRKP